ncbi:ribonuclease R [Sabulicella rubraurantiaca]|uniref:ribonuclease R n=1 Tax=Sabulicella rubraurantiaca TaxID=2811429 RepID=UPI001A974E83|nr:ribonuclease R [Sabulicella rubraurantiaca]
MRRGPPAKGHKARPGAKATRAPRAKVKGAPRAIALPSRAEIRAFLAQAQGRVGKTEIARHFGLPTEMRPALRQLLSEMTAEGAAAPVGKRTLRAPERLPDTAVVEVTGTDPDGDAIARPVNWGGEGRPVIYMHAERRGQPALAPGERVLARLRHITGEKYEGRTLKRLGTAGEARRVLGIYNKGRITPTDRRHKAEWDVPEGEHGGAEHGEIVLAEALPSSGFGRRPARVVERLGMSGEARSISLICIHQHGIPDVFPEEALAEAKRARGVALGKRTDLRDLPLVTIDGEDARDFDDAVFAEPDGEGWRVVVAIADVAHYVQTGSALDREAWARGNSVYFPDRVVPMLPEALSNGWCSLKPEEERGCLFVEMRFDKSGTKTEHRFGRGLMRSFARLTYESVQAHHGAGTDPEALERGHVGQLYGAFRALLAARERRGTLDLDLPERKVVLSPEGKVLGVSPRPRLDSHRLIEEFMVAANVCAAEELERLGQPCMYRIHAPPSEEKLLSLREFLSTLGLSLNPQGQLRPGDFANLLQQVEGRPEARMVHETVLRSQSQAAYEPDNIGHFGLALARYAHFTSPIRRYADLLVHRALVRGLKLGTDGLTEAEAARFVETGEHITATERRAAQAERDAVDRYLTAFLSDKVGATFAARISGIHPFGLFVTLEETGASGFVPMKALPDDHWLVEEGNRRLLGRHSRQILSLGDPVEARLREANPTTGSLVFDLQMGGAPARITGRDRRRKG